MSDRRSCCMTARHRKILRRSDGTKQGRPLADERRNNSEFPPRRETLFFGVDRPSLSRRSFPTRETVFSYGGNAPALRSLTCSM